LSLGCEQLKNNLQIVTLAVGGAGLAGAYFSYSAEIAARCSFCCANLVEALWL